MTERKGAKRHRFSREILGLVGISAAFALILFLVLTHIAATVAQVYCFENDIPMTEFDWMDVERWIFGVGGGLSVCLFSILFLSLLGQRLAYIRKITGGIDAMRLGEQNPPIPLEGNNELTELAAAINYMSAARQEMAQKEKELAQEKEQLTRTLSHDIRTPLTSILAYSEYLAANDSVSVQERQNYLRMMQRKAEQIRDLTDILLDESRRKPEFFENAHLLLEQLAAEFEENLEDAFLVRITLPGCEALPGTFDVQELRRIFDNLSSNVRKYADPAHPVDLTISREENDLIICQSNTVLPQVDHADSYKLGISSIRRIAQHYGGKVTVLNHDGKFEITVKLIVNV